MKDFKKLAEKWANEEIKKLQPVLDSIQQRKEDVIEQIISYYQNVYEGVTVVYYNEKFTISGRNEENNTKVERELKEMLKFSAKTNKNS